MMDQAPDDIFALYSRFDLDGDNYRVFTRPDPVLLKSLAAAPEPLPEPSSPIEEVKPPQPVPQAPLPTAQERPMRTPQERPLVAAHMLEPEPLETASESLSRFALHNLMRNVVPVRKSVQILDAPAFAAACISVRATAGGAGSTTVSATLARLLVKSKRRCAIIDETDDLTLPIFFGSQRIPSDHRRFSGLQAIVEPTVRVLTRDLFPLSTESSPGSTFIERHAAHLAAEFDHLIFDHPSRSTELKGAGLTIYVAVPDLNSLVGARKLKADLEGIDTSRELICVLNRFDPTVALHREVLPWYEENFPHVVTISHSHLVPEALAEGTTVVDWAPQSRVSADFLRLLNLVSHLLFKRNSSEPNLLDEATPGKKGLPLCS